MNQIAGTIDPPPDIGEKVTVLWGGANKKMFYCTVVERPSSRRPVPPVSVESRPASENLDDSDDRISQIERSVESFGKKLDTLSASVTSLLNAIGVGPESAPNSISAKTDQCLAKLTVHSEIIGQMKESLGNLIQKTTGFGCKAVGGCEAATKAHAGMAERYEEGLTNRGVISIPTVQPCPCQSVAKSFNQSQNFVRCHACSVAPATVPSHQLTSPTPPSENGFCSHHTMPSTSSLPTISRQNEHGPAINPLDPLHCRNCETVLLGHGDCNFQMSNNRLFSQQTMSSTSSLPTISHQNEHGGPTMNPFDPLYCRNCETVLVGHTDCNFEMSKSDYLNALKRTKPELILLSLLDSAFRDEDGMSTLPLYTFSGSQSKKALKNTDRFKATFSPIHEMCPNFQLTDKAVKPITAKCSHSAGKQISTVNDSVRQN